MVLPGCANIIPPQGGARDTLPPQLIKASPEDSTRNFTGTRITFSFNEFIDLQNIQENLLVSPSPKTNPFVESKLNSITVRIKDSLEANTTYSLNFGNAIKDYNEGNILKGFTYVFSTGPFIDSLELHGKVVLAETGKVDTTIVVILHSNSSDSAVVKEKPRYLAKLNGEGHFVFKNLPPKTFYLYAIKDEGGSLRYFNDKQLFAFADSPVVAGLKSEPVTLYAYATKSPTLLSIVSSLNIGTKKKAVSETADKRLKFQTNLVGNQQDLQGNFIMTFDQPLRMFDSSKIHLYTDSAFFPVQSYLFKKDSSSRKIQLDIVWKENTSYHIILDKDFAEDSSGKKLLKTDTLNFKTKSLNDYGSLLLKFHGLDIVLNPVLQFIINDNIYKSFPLTNSTFSQTLFLPGDYELRILYDKNKNGIWDPGAFFGKHKQPELVNPIQRKITVKPAWQNEFDISL
ncbi:MAG: Ig-like domain-containing protein [Chitinophagaceae bacterium]